MVDALLEIWRVLVPEGNLIDLRPVHSNPPLELFTAGSRHVLGHVIDEMGRLDDIAAIEAMAEVVRRGYFTAQMQEMFKFAVYWDTLDGLVAYAKRKWRNKKHLPQEDLERVRQHISATDGRYRLCIPSTMHLAVYRKQEATEDNSTSAI
jgi:hypothetical protein